MSVAYCDGVRNQKRCLYLSIGIKTLVYPYTARGVMGDLYDKGRPENPLQASYTRTKTTTIRAFPPRYGGTDNIYCDTNASVTF